MRRAWMAALLLASAPAPLPPPTPATIAALPPEATAGVGAALPFVEHEAESATTNGRVIGPDRRFTTLAAEASGRRAVVIDAPGRYVEFTLAKPANALTVRYAIPDTADGRGRDATLGVYGGGVRIGELSLSSRYGWFYGAYPFTNRPADGKGHHFYDHARMLLGRTLPAGSTIRLEAGPGDRAPWYAIDLADFELVPPTRQRPPGSVSVLDHGADPGGVRDSLPAFRRAVAVARGGVLWIPPGRYKLPGHLELDRVTVAGAGAWHSMLIGHGVGLYGRAAPRPSTDVHVRDLAIIGEVTERVDKLQLNAIGGAMSRSSLSDLFLQHVKVGVWFDGPMEDIRVARLRVFDVTADGLNFHRGVRRAVLEDSLFRGTGDDGIAAWSGGVADRDVVIRRNTVIAPVLANGIAIYGGRDIRVERNLVADTLTQGGGLHLGNRFKAVPLAGDIRLSGNIVVRGGSFDPNWRFGVGALWFYALDAPIRGRIAVTDTRLIDSSEEGVLFIGKRIDGVRLDRVTIDGTGGPAITARAAGSAVVSRFALNNVRAPIVMACPRFVLQIVDRASRISLARPIADRTMCP